MLNVVTSKKCTVCLRPAFGHNYGTLSCDACKMFFRRVAMLKLKYHCEWRSQCFNGITLNSPVPRCRACRFQKCLKVGMFFLPSISRKSEGQDGMLISRLLYLDTRRSKMLMSRFTFENPRLEDIVERKKIKWESQREIGKLSCEDWRFFNMFTAVEFLMSLDFMKHLDSKDKTSLIRSFTAKATLLFSSRRTVLEKSDKLITPGGEEIVQVETLHSLCNLSMRFLSEIRSLLVGKLIELEITNEEFLLVTVVLFCDPALSMLSDSARTCIANQQKIYSNALFQYCQVNYQHAAPSRFADLLSLCHVVNKNIEDIRNLTIIVKLCMPGAECKRLFDDVI